MNLRDELHDAAARRAVIVDRVSMGDPQADCMACRAKGMIAAAVLFVAGLAMLGRRSGGPK